MYQPKSLIITLVSNVVEGKANYENYENENEIMKKFQVVEGKANYEVQVH